MVRIWEHVPLYEAVERVLAAIKHSSGTDSLDALPDTVGQAPTGGEPDRPVLDEARPEP